MHENIPTGVNALSTWPKSGPGATQRSVIRSDRLPCLSLRVWNRADITANLAQLEAGLRATTSTGSYLLWY